MNPELKAIIKMLQTAREDGIEAEIVYAFAGWLQVGCDIEKAAHRALEEYEYE